MLSSHTIVSSSRRLLSRTASSVSIPLSIHNASSQNSTNFHSQSIGACHKILELDEKKRTVAKEIAADFRSKKISIADMRPETLAEVHKFPFTIQNSSLRRHAHFRKGY